MQGEESMNGFKYHAYKGRNNELIAAQNCIKMGI